MTAPVYAMMRMKFDKRRSMNNPKENIVEVVKDLSENDRTRLFQCVLCENDPETCGCNEKDEDKNGMCLKHRPVVIV